MDNYMDHYLSGFDFSPLFALWQAGDPKENLITRIIREIALVVVFVVGVRDLTGRLKTVPKTLWGTPSNSPYDPRFQDSDWLIQKRGRDEQ